MLPLLVATQLATGEGNISSQPSVLSSQNDPSEIFYKRICDIGAAIVGNASRLTLHILHQSIKVITRIRNTYHADGGSIPEAGGLEFRYRNIEMNAEPVLETAYYLTFVFKRLRGFNVEFESKKRDHQSLVISRWSMAKPQKTNDQ